MGVLVLGMHRSGTSALTRVISLLGFHVGDDDALVEATEANPAGHWEVEALSLFNEELLLALGGKWSAPPSASPPEVAVLAEGEFGARGKELIDQAFAGRPWVWKDPRLCLLLPFWRRVLEEPPVVVAPLRNPLEVAESLAKRNDLLPTYALALWERHLRRAIIDADGLATLVVDYGGLLARPRPVWNDLASFFDARDVTRETAQPFDEVTAFIDPTLHRQQRSDDAFRAVATAEQVALWDHVMSRLGDQSGPWSDDLPAESPGLQLLFDEHKRLSHYEDLVAQQRDSIEDLQLNNQTLQDWLADSRADAGHAWSEVRRLEGQHREAVESKAIVMDYLEEVIAERDRLRDIIERLKSLPPVRLALALRRRLTP